MVLDTSISPQSYVEDCEVCCNPLYLSFEVDGGAIDSFDAQPAQ